MVSHHIETVARYLGFPIGDLQFLSVGPLKEVNLLGLRGLQNEYEFEANYPKFSPEREAEILRKWEALKSPYPSKPIAAITAIEEKEGILSIWMAPAGFHQYIGTMSEFPRRLEGPFVNLDKDFIMPVSFGGIIVTSDDYIPVGKRSSQMAVGTNRLNLIPSGFFDPVNETVQTGATGKKTSHPSLLSALAAELLEEARVTWYSEITLLGLVQDCVQSQQPQLQVRVRVPFTKEELQKKLELMLKEEGKESEITRYDFIENTPAEVKNYPGIWTPHSKAMLILHFATTI